MEIALIPLSKEYDVRQFDCGNQNLNEYVRRYALKNDNLKIGKTFLAVTGEEKIAGYITLSNAHIEQPSLPRNIAQKLPRYPVPAIRISRLAVDSGFQRQGVGGLLLYKVFEKAIEVNKNSGVYAVLVDAIDEKAKSFYEHYGFRLLQDSPLSLFIPLAAVEAGNA